MNGHARCVRLLNKVIVRPVKLVAPLHVPRQDREVTTTDDSIAEVVVSYWLDANGTADDDIHLNLAILVKGSTVVESQIRRLVASVDYDLILS